MKYNLHSDTELSYPHHTKITGNEILIVTSKENLIKAGDIVFSLVTYCGYAVPETKIKSIIEQRPAKGEHKIDAIFQRCAI